jgi:hypothetical protein
VDARAWVAREGVVTLVDTGGPPSVVGTIAGERVVGSWWAHARGGEMYALGQALEDDPDVWSLRLVDGKASFVHRALWPALVRVVTDPAWTVPRRAALPPSAAALLARVESEGTVDVPGSGRRDRERIERALLAAGRTRRGEHGSHQATLVDWTIFAGPVRDDAAGLGFDEAMDILTRACRGRSIGG